MSDLLEAGASWLDRQRVKFLSRAVTYCRGSDSAEVQAAVGRTVFEVDDGYGVVERFESRDFLVTAADLTLGLPQPGDTIRETQDGRVYMYQVMAPGKEPCWRWSDPFRKTLRIHTKQIGQEAA
ncbi:MAG: hypothetical protein ACE15C_21785 [Phycisphaerae bacterium]